MSAYHWFLLIFNHTNSISYPSTSLLLPHPPSLEGSLCSHFLFYFIVSSWAMCLQQISCKIKQPFPSFFFFFFSKVLWEKRCLEELSYNKQVWMRLGSACERIHSPLDDPSVVPFPLGVPFASYWMLSLEFFSRGIFPSVPDFHRHSPNEVPVEMCVL